MRVSKITSRHGQEFSFIEGEKGYPLVTYPDPFLREKTWEVSQDKIDDDFKLMIGKLIFQMYSSRGIGIAANQCGMKQRIVIIDVDYPTSEVLSPKICINPKICQASENIFKSEESCLSVPLGYSALVERRTAIQVSYRDLEWNEHIEFVEGLESACFQHETDHLDGILFIDHLSRLKRQMYDKKLYKKVKQYARGMNE